MDRTYLVIGLGNPGEKYQNTRHNFGFMAAERFVRSNELSDFVEKKKLKSEVSEDTFEGAKVIVAKPTTYMNNSGEAFALLKQFYKPDEILIIYDDVDLDFGCIRVREGGSSAGHNGVESILQHGGKSDFRIRLGINNPINAKADTKDFVLGRFTKDEEEQLDAILTYTDDLIAEFISEDISPHTEWCVNDLD